MMGVESSDEAAEGFVGDGEEGTDSGDDERELNLRLRLWCGLCGVTRGSSSSELLLDAISAIFGARGGANAGRLLSLPLPVDEDGEAGASTMGRD